MEDKNKKPVSEEQDLQAELKAERAKNAQLEADKAEQAAIIKELSEQLAQSEARIKQTERKHGQVAITFEGRDYHLAAPKISTPLGVITAEQLADDAKLLAKLVKEINGFVDLYLKPVPAQEKGI
ncbi:hypothetical protein SAMN05421780_108187 [Flexibacter flexilis DSM 6793]|uniref:Uncharacterized protein n=1 Tax=Flexibacter flexilis DSM 6793 TaxID=927664 RepID=A0A1I1LDV5_9BACT|nr:hypothetical protein [Flexibacter flexilis]SFC71199.1 hypothetical protein SAMN05421780_108187 [Flexibacter flexilis DSM 6793]